MAVATHHVSPARLTAVRDVGFPILLLTGSQDQLIHDDNMKGLYAQLKSDHIQIHIYDDAGHGVADKLIQNFEEGQ